LGANSCPTCGNEIKNLRNKHTGEEAKIFDPIAKVLVPNEPPTQIETPIRGIPSGPLTTEITATPIDNATVLIEEKSTPLITAIPIVNATPQIIVDKSTQR